VKAAEKSESRATRAATGGDVLEDRKDERQVWKSVATPRVTERVMV